MRNIFASNINLFIFGMLALMGFIFLTIAYRSWSTSKRIVENGVKTEGVVIDIVQNKTKRKRTSAKAPVVQFKTENGDVTTYYSTTYTTPCPYEIGQIVPIWYLPEDPQQATLQGADSYILPIAFAVFGLVVTLISLPFLFKLFIRLIYQ